MVSVMRVERLTWRVWAIFGLSLFIVPFVAMIVGTAPTLGES